jgi:hypothetical protein
MLCSHRVVGTCIDWAGRGISQLVCVVRSEGLGQGRDETIQAYRGDTYASKMADMLFGMYTGVPRVLQPTCWSA